MPDYDYDYYESYTFPVSGDPSYWLMPDDITHRKYMPEADITYRSTSEPWVDEAEETGYIRAVRADHYDGIPDGEPLILVWTFARDDDTGELCVDFTAQPDSVLEADAN